MRKFYLLLMLIGLASSSAFAQYNRSNEGGAYNFGLKVSGDLDSLFNQNLLNDKEVHYLSSVGYHIGIAADKKLAEGFDLALNILYSGFSEHLHEKASLPDWSKNIKLNYLDFPILAKFKGDYFYVEAGPQFSYLISAEDNFSSVGQPSLDYDYKGAVTLQRFQRINISGVLGGGAIVSRFDKNSLSVGLRIVYGINDIINDKGYYGAGIPYPASLLPGYNPPKGLSMYDISVDNMPVRLFYIGLTVELNIEY